MGKPLKKGSAGTALGYRSGLEDRNSIHLKRLGVPVIYEQYKLKYVKKPSTYTPDYLLQNGIVIETKGYFDSADRAKHLLIKEQHPQLDLRFVFANPDNYLAGQKVTEFRKWLKSKHGLTVPVKIPPAIKAEYQPTFFATLKTKPSQTTYADWCERKGFQYATETIPIDWIMEPPTDERLEAAEKALGWTQTT